MAIDTSPRAAESRGGSSSKDYFSPSSTNVSSLGSYSTQGTSGKGRDAYTPPRNRLDYSTPGSSGKGREAFTNVSDLDFAGRLGYEYSGIKNSFDTVSKNILRAAGMAIPGAGMLTSGMIGLTTLARALDIPVGRIKQTDIDGALNTGQISDSEHKGFSSTLRQGGGSVTDFITNPMDIFGSFASGTRGDIETTLYGSARAGIEAQEEQRDRIKALYEPFYQSAVSGGLQQLQALSQGGDVDYTPSKLYEYSKERGERNIKRTQAAKGQLKSSATEERLSDFRLGLAEEEMDRLYQGQLSRVQLGAGAADAVGSANRSLGSNVSSLYTGLGGSLNAAQQNYGEARQSAYSGLSSTLMGLAKYMEAA